MMARLRHIALADVRVADVALAALLPSPKERRFQTLDGSRAGLFAELNAPTLSASTAQRRAVDDVQVGGSAQGVDAGAADPLGWRHPHEHQLLGHSVAVTPPPPRARLPQRVEAACPLAFEFGTGHLLVMSSKVDVRRSSYTRRCARAHQKKRVRSQSF